jgi:hypothetical protein
MRQARKESSVETKRTDTSAVLGRVPKRDIATSVQCLLWGRAAGRCQFAGCNRPLWKSLVTQEVVNIAEKAHIYAFSTNGPRGNRRISKGKINSIENLFLVCHDCHRKIDREKSGGRYGAAFVVRMKADHERRVERVTAIASDKKSHVVLYGANIGDHSSPLNYGDATEALFPFRYPAIDVAIELGTVASSFADRDSAFWEMEVESLRRKFATAIRERLAVGDIAHLSVFALAPQPLLVLLGTMLGDIVPADVYQRHREPRASWQWPKRAAVPEFIEEPPARHDGRPALLLALSGTVTTDRVMSVLGDTASVWTITVARPHNDVIKSPRQLSALRSLLRRVLDQIKAAHGQNTVLHIFPVASNSVNIELGRVRMPKADMPWQIYDQLHEHGGFVPAVTIGTGA